MPSEVTSDCGGQVKFSAAMSGSSRIAEFLTSSLRGQGSKPCAGQRHDLGEFLTERRG